jgi:hypothetical protein
MKDTQQQLRLPKPIEHYFTADGADADAVSQCFNETAVVKDDGHTHRGRAAIKQWCADAFAKYSATSEPFACELKDGRFIVTSQVSGNFPGSPINLRFSFKLEADKIESLEISE